MRAFPTVRLSAAVGACDRWPEVMPEPHDAELIVRDNDTVTHSIEETARHADIIRETLDGSRGI